MTQSSRNTYKTSKLTPTKMETTKKTTKETTPSNNHTSPNHLSNSSDKRIIWKAKFLSWKDVYLSPSGLIL